MGTTPAIRIAGLTKSYGDLEVLRGVDLDVAPGSIFALLGSNGAGKTTIVKILSTLLKADGGTTEVNGFDVVTRASEVRVSISLTGQFAAVDEILTGRENLVLIAKLRHVDHPGRIADDLLARFSLTDAGGRRVATYSGGMRRRLDIGADYWMERGAADALVRLFGSRRLRPTVTFAEAAKIVGVSGHAAREAINRLQRAHRPKARRRNAPGPAPAGTKWCGYGEHFPRLEDFAPNRSATTGLQSWCRSCMVLARREQRERQAEQVPGDRSAA